MKLPKSVLAIAMSAMIGVMTFGAGAASAQSIVTKSGETITQEQIQSFFATNPTEYQIAAAAKAKGLTIEQTAQAWKIGQGYVKNAGNAWQESSYLAMAAHAMGGNFILAGPQPGGGTLITEPELKGFFAGNPDDHAIAVEAAKLSMNIEQVQAALTYGRGDPFYQSKKIVDAVNAMTDIGFQGSRIVAGSGPKSDPKNSGRNEFAPGKVIDADPNCVLAMDNPAAGCLSSNRWLDSKAP